MRLSRHAVGAAFVLALGAVPAFAADCPSPGPAPTIPDGTTATVDQLKTAHEQVAFDALRVAEPVGMAELARIGFELGRACGSTGWCGTLAVCFVSSTCTGDCAY